MYYDFTYIEIKLLLFNLLMINPGMEKVID